MNEFDAIFESIKRTAALRLEQKRAVIPILCAECPIDSERMATCKFLHDPDCKHGPALEKRIREKSKAARARSAKVPAKYLPELAGIAQCNASGAVWRVLRGELSAAVLLGTPGSGKTLCASFALAERGGLFCPASSLDVLNAETANTIERLCGEPMAVLDDVGRGRSATVLALDRTEDILCRRYDAGLPTIVTANLTRGEFWGLHAIGGGRVLDRLGEESITLCREPSRRQQPAHWQEDEK